MTTLINHDSNHSLSLNSTGTAIPRRSWKYRVGYPQEPWYALISSGVPPLRLVLLVGVHLCGMLSIYATRLFKQVPKLMNLYMDWWVGSCPPPKLAKFQQMFQYVSNILWAAIKTPQDEISQSRLLLYLRGSWNYSRGSTAEGLAEVSMFRPFAAALRNRLCMFKIMIGYRMDREHTPEVDGSSRKPLHTSPRKPKPKPRKHGGRERELTWVDRNRQRVLNTADVLLLQELLDREVDG